MSQAKLDQIIERQSWMKGVDQAVQKVADVALNNPVVGRHGRNFLHGTWLGHPLHPVLTDAAIGPWFVTVVLDAAEISTGDESLAPGADAALTIGLVGGTAAAISGLNDWQHLDGHPRRVGLTHALVNIAASGLLGTSWFLRRNGARRAGQACSFAGFLVTCFSAYLGGRLIYEHKIGVTHSEAEKLPQEFTPVLDQHELHEGEPHQVKVGDIDVLLVKHEGQIYALSNRCSHLGGPLNEGEFKDGTIRCPWHGSCYSVEDGHVIEGPSAFPQPCLDVRVANGRIEVCARVLGGTTVPKRQEIPAMQMAETD